MYVIAYLYQCTSWSPSVYMLLLTFINVPVGVLQFICYCLPLSMYQSESFSLYVIAYLYQCTSRSPSVYVIAYLHQLSVDDIVLLNADVPVRVLQSL